ncbi:MAG: CsgG/HfaB family protein [Candidatus Firestonebacteria bacterium]
MTTFFALRKSIYFIGVFLFFAFIIFPVESAEKIRIAVSDLKPEGVSSVVSNAVTNFLVVELINTKRFDLLDRKNMEVILKEQAFQQTGCTSQECAIQLGRILNVQKVVMGSINKLGGKFYINVSFVDIETGKIEFAEKNK